MDNNRITSLMQFLNFCELNGHTNTAALLRVELALAMAPVVTAHPFSAAA